MVGNKFARGTDWEHGTSTPSFNLQGNIFFWVVLDGSQTNSVCEETSSRHRRRCYDYRYSAESLTWTLPQKSAVPRSDNDGEDCKKSKQDGCLSEGDLQGGVYMSTVPSAKCVKENEVDSGPRVQSRDVIDVCEE